VEIGSKFSENFEIKRWTEKKRITVAPAKREPQKPGAPLNSEPARIEITAMAAAGITAPRQRLFALLFSDI
jgi:hypothetical protein